MKLWEDLTRKRSDRICFPCQPRAIKLSLFLCFSSHTYISSLTPKLSCKPQWWNRYVIAIGTSVAHVKENQSAVQWVSLHLVTAGRHRCGSIGIMRVRKSWAEMSESISRYESKSSELSNSNRALQLLAIYSAEAHQWKYCVTSCEQWTQLWLLVYFCLELYNAENVGRFNRHSVYTFTISCNMKGTAGAPCNQHRQRNILKCAVRIFK